ncbi:YidB family protein [Budvicia diplopodorum]|uniref:YidB family protein n=1 Tax=Budvicia diplopodorum TaxID=1119056 RepID=UPI0013597794|nr:YidB family protein [Budvicia diplopodorum]
MSLLDQLGGALGSKGSIDYVAIMQWVEQQGGISGLLEKFRHGGLTEVVQSWIGNGTNQPITGDRVEQVLSSDALQQLATKLGIDSQAASGIIAQFLPEIVNKLSPDGQEPGNADMISAGLSMLTGKLFG